VRRAELQPRFLRLELHCDGALRKLPHHAGDDSHRRSFFASGHVHHRHFSVSERNLTWRLSVARGDPNDDGMNQFAAARFLELHFPGPDEPQALIPLSSEEANLRRRMRSPRALRRMHAARVFE